MIRPFGPNEFLFILTALQWTLALSAVAFVGGILVGLAIAIFRVFGGGGSRLVARAYIRLFQGTPLLMQLFLTYFGLSLLGVGINPWLAASIALTLHASAFLGEIWRGCIETVPVGQSEAARALGLPFSDRLRWIILPQAVRVAVAPTVGFLVQLVKATSLASIIGFVEITRAGQIINNATFEPFKVFGFVALLYFLLCWPLSLWSRRIEARTSGKI